MRTIETPLSTRLGFFPPSTRFFGGGSGSVAPSAPPPITTAPVPATAAPATSSSAEVVQAAADTRRQALKKKGFSKTVFAGDTGGWFQSGNTVPGPTNPKAAGTSVGPGAKTLGS